MLRLGIPGKFPQAVKPRGYTTAIRLHGDGAYLRYNGGPASQFCTMFAFLYMDRAEAVLGDENFFELAHAADGLGIQGGTHFYSDQHPNMLNSAYYWLVDGGAGYGVCPAWGDYVTDTNPMFWFHTGQWYATAVRFTPTGVHTYFGLPNAESLYGYHVTGAGDLPKVWTGAPDILVVGREVGEPPEYPDVRICGLKIWSADLTEAQILAETASVTPVLRTGLWDAWTLVDATLTGRTSLNGRVFTPLGPDTITVEPGPFA